MKRGFIRRFCTSLESVYFRRLYVSYAVITAIIAGISGAVLYDRAGKSANDELEHQSLSRLAGVQSYLENSYPNAFKNAFVSNLLSAVDTPGSDAFSVFYEEYGQNVYQIYHLVNHIKTIVAAQPDAENVTVYFKNTNFMVDKYAFFPMGEHSQGAELINRLQRDEISTNRWLQRNVYYGEGVSDRLMTFAYSFPEQAKGKDIQGYMLIDIRADRFRHILDNLADIPGEKLLMFSVMDGYVTGSGNVSEADISRVMDSWEQRPGNSDRQVSFLAAAEGESEWVYASIRPSGMAAPASAEMQRYIVYVCLGAIVFGVFFAYYLALKSYKPVRNMLLRLKERNGGLFDIQQRNEFQALDFVLTGLYTTIHQLSQKVNGSLLLALLNGRLAEDEMPEQVHVAQAYIVVTVKLDGSKSKELAAALQQTGTLPHVAIEKDASELGILYFSDETDTIRERVREELRRVLPLLSREGCYTIGVGSTVHAREDIVKSNEHAISALKYTFLLGSNNLYDYEEICKRDVIPQIDYEPFEKALRAGNGAAAEQFIKDFAERIDRNPVPLETAEFALAQLSMILSKVMIDVNAKERMFPADLPYQQARKATFGETVASIREQSVQIAGHIERYLLQHAQHEVIYSLKKYIDNHLHEDISLDQLAGMAGLSTQYLSRQFKEIAGVSFIEYLTSARMERACALLQQSKTTVTDIATQVGYNNAQYFCARFKSKLGITPMQYRNSFKIDAERPEQAGQG